MLIDWFTVFAQIINFLVLLWLLKRFLYGPIIRAMDGREEKIAARITDAQEKQAQAEEEIRRFRQKREELDTRREEIIRGAEQDAEDRRRHLMAKIRSEISDLRERWKESIAEEKDAFLRGIQKQAGKQIYAVARKAMSDLADVDLEHHMIDSFILQLKDIGKDERKGMAESLRSSERRLTVCTVFDLGSADRQRITRAIHEYVMDGITVDYEKDEEIICGIEIRTDGYVIGWNLEEYLKSLEEKLDTALEQELRSPERMKKRKEMIRKIFEAGEGE